LTDPIKLRGAFTYEKKKHGLNRREVDRPEIEEGRL